MTNFPECTSEDKTHVWGKWELFEKKKINGVYIIVTTTQKRQCGTCGLTQFLNEDEQHPTS